MKIFFSYPERLNRLWGPLSLIFNGYQGMNAWSSNWTPPYAFMAYRWATLLVHHLQTGLCDVESGFCEVGGESLLNCSCQRGWVGRPVPSLTCIESRLECRRTSCFETSILFMCACVQILAQHVEMCRYRILSNCYLYFQTVSISMCF
jgi:hypothetical protein